MIEFSTFIVLGNSIFKFTCKFKFDQFSTFKKSVRNATIVEFRGIYWNIYWVQIRTAQEAKCHTKSEIDKKIFFK